VKIKVLCNSSAIVEGEVNLAFVFSPSLRWRFAVMGCNREHCCYQKQNTVGILPSCYTCWSSSKCMLFCFCSTSVCVCVWESNSTLKSEFQNSKFEQIRISHRVAGCSGETGSNLGNVTEYHMVSVVTLCCHLEGLWWLTPRSGSRQLRYRFIPLQLTWTHLSWPYVITAFERVALNKVQPTRTL